MGRAEVEMWLLGAVVLLSGLTILSWGASPLRDRDSEANAAIRRGAVLVPMGLALMFADAPRDGGALPTSFYGLYILATTLMAAIVVVRFSEHRKEETGDAEPDTAAHQRTALKRLNVPREAPPRKHVTSADGARELVRG